MSDILSQLVPINLLEEKSKFFADRTYNPQFQYLREFSALELTGWGLPLQPIYDHAQKMIANYGNPPAPPFETVDEEYVRAKIEEFNQRYQLDEPIQVHFLEQQASRCRISGTQIYFQVPLRYSKERFQDLLRHELETHVLRSINHAKNFPNYIKNEYLFRRTEEGLAGLHSFILRKNKITLKSYHTYSAVFWAQRYSFSEVFQKLKSLDIGDQRAWNITLRTKRGLTDSSMPGGFTKDICYLEGMVQVWKWIKSHPQQIQKLYVGRLSLDEIDQISDQQSFASLLLPSFFQDQTQYLENIAEIAKVNEFTTIGEYVTYA
jgi:hypothetical protein